jgi:DNA repair protein RAD5
MLDIIEIPLKEHQLMFNRLDGSLCRVKRDKALYEFKSNEKVRILIASLRTSGVGLNLTVACNIKIT